MSHWEGFSFTFRASFIWMGFLHRTPAFADRLRHDLGKPIVVTDNWQSCLEGVGILVEASRLPAPQVHFKTAWIKPGALVIPYGTMSAVEDDITDVMDKVVVGVGGMRHSQDGQNHIT